MTDWSVALRGYAPIYVSSWTEADNNRLIALIIPYWPCKHCGGEEGRRGGGDETWCSYTALVVGMVETGACVKRGRGRVGGAGWASQLAVPRRAIRSEG